MVQAYIVEILIKYPLYMNSIAMTQLDFNNLIKVKQFSYYLPNMINYSQPYRVILSIN